LPTSDGASAPAGAGIPRRRRRGRLDRPGPGLVVEQRVPLFGVEDMDSCCGGLSRRELLKSAACGFGFTALTQLCADALGASGETPALPAAHLPPRARRVIFLFMHGGPSHM